jgi:hypothetical protein
VEIAKQYQHPDVGTLHLLAGLLDEPNAAQRLRTVLSIDASAVRAEVGAALADLGQP